MKKVLPLIIAVIVITSGCIGAQNGSTSTTGTSPTTSKVMPVDFKSYGKGEVLANWFKIADTSEVYVSIGYEDLARHYFPNAKILPAEDYKGGIALLSPKDARTVLRGKPILITVNDYFGYIVYKSGLKFVGPDKGVMAAFNDNGKAHFVFTGTSKAGAGAALEYAMRLREGAKVNVDDIVRSGDFEGVVLKVIGDNDWDGIPDEGESWYLTSFKAIEPFIYYWRIVEGENVTVSGGFIRLVNGSTVYIHALGFNVSIRVKNPKNKELTYIIENINPRYVEVSGETKSVDMGGTEVKVVSSSDEVSIVPKDVADYRIIAFGDHRPDGGTKPPEVFLKIRDEINKDEGVFIIDGGDLVYTGRVDEWAALLKEWKWNKPIFVAPGNHEYRGEGINVFHMLFGPDNYAFSFGKYRYIIVNDVEENYGLSDETFAWIEEQMKAAVSNGQRPVLVLHAPPIDPRPNGDHAMNPSDGEKLLQLMKKYNAFGIFSHIHIYWYGEEDGVQMLITGGGGAPLYAPPDRGGFYHYVRMYMADNGTITVEPVKVEP
ncbi:metallophosphoesterase family protein [Thermococcus gorgonarius]|uniref:Phosphoesterase n=1 Tax=Thermococcus gorgonarius TaxID=71997 RepID=A0A2Z2MHC0_THEGO|nr:metallophosphoesterase [Thermococcus gorgonarius]ASJ01368.1 phosphoesterase [Thermococcus gorgonarius]